MAVSKKDRVHTAIRAQILSGELPTGHKMKSTRLLEEEYGVSYGTLNTVINMLKIEKLLVGYQGDGVYVRRKPGEPAED
ncbi:GntR family transcriptional regulator [Catenuloplanes sp. NPDC051500]|jgi:DNA-binding GntR family transcriptional regulator|uniref:GntR family transcriptional regulator n=1 Tax=Catenuloplanes sp. NPDC051500 TaxID=3363959 RepID=UPI003793C125